MKNKKSTYILLLAVVLIWGIILYKIFAAVGSDEAVQREMVSYGSILPVKSGVDTFSISANYRDPFLGKMASALPEGGLPKTSVKKPEPPKPAPAPWPQIVYKGMIKNQKTNKQLYLVTINSQDNMMKPGDIISDVELKKVYKDSIQVVFRKEIKTFKK